MQRRDLMQGAAGLLCVCGLAQAQPTMRRVGWLGWRADTTPVPSIPLQAFRAGLTEQGWKEGDNLVLEVRIGEREQAPALAAELLQAGVELIVAQGAMVFASRGRTGSTPLLFMINGDPVEAGLVASLARPGGLATGVTALGVELAGKRLELLKNAKPGIKRLAVFANGRHPGVVTELAASRAVASALGLELNYFPVTSAADMDSAFAAISAYKPEALVAFPDTLINQQAKPVAAFCTQARLPSISGFSEFAVAGNLMSYGPSLAEFYRQLARYADKILRGAKPADLPVEQPTRLSLTLNMNAATSIGLSVPQSLRLRADEILQ
jgi:putative tryptophan/tyrosine transport system substrate-binding protein